MTSPVLVFGPTGGVGSAAAIEAHKRGSKVYLAMRNTKKELKGIQEDGNSYVRIQADLAKPETIKQAVKTSGAKTAFVYVIYETKDAMRSSFEALKEAGIMYIVLLSSFKVQDPLTSEANKKDNIAAFHAAAEGALRETGVPYVAVRPAWFNSNIFWNVEDIKKGGVEVLYPNVVYDYLAPSDIGTVCGTLLTEPRLQKEAGQSIYLCGPKLMTQHEGYAVLSKVLGKEIKIKEIGEERFSQKYGYMPKPVLDTLVRGMRESNSGHDSYAEIYDKGVENLRKYTEREPTKFEDWVKENQAAFT
ncbi:uncharacterized protein ALTATR162_LOCUS9716 [Alternaria atra]|uniref:NAD(P)-binding domain-containing protein n=1 Tax=Alternaria atra TaxID=119953 RepID=A0A8J2I9X7_9PLEO|nr:uncharacterized protein ALTATR162_LOCUS9716 [Alternaria atra]CAG5181346.1 unnamed protein product [Alternaria atra]